MLREWRHRLAASSPKASICERTCFREDMLMQNCRRACFLRLEFREPVVKRFAYRREQSPPMPLNSATVLEQSVHASGRATRENSGNVDVCEVCELVVLVYHQCCQNKGQRVACSQRTMRFAAPCKATDPFATHSRHGVYTKLDITRLAIRGPPTQELRRCANLLHIQQLHSENRSGYQRHTHTHTTSCWQKQAIRPSQPHVVRRMRSWSRFEPTADCAECADDAVERDSRTAADFATAQSINFMALDMILTSKMRQDGHLAINKPTTRATVLHIWARC